MGEAGFRINPTLEVMACELAGDFLFLFEVDCDVIKWDQYLLGGSNKCKRMGNCFRKIALNLVHALGKVSLTNPYWFQKDSVENLWIAGGAISTVG